MILQAGQQLKKTTNKGRRVRGSTRGLKKTVQVSMNKATWDTYGHIDKSFQNQIWYMKNSTTGKKGHVLVSLIGEKGTFNAEP